MRPSDRAGNELWEECDKYCEREQAPRRLDVLAKHVERVGHPVERVEGDSDRQQDVNLRRA